MTNRRGITRRKKAAAKAARQFELGDLEAKNDRELLFLAYILKVKWRRENKSVVKAAYSTLILHIRDIVKERKDGRQRRPPS